MLVALSDQLYMRKVTRLKWFDAREKIPELYGTIVSA
jgi:hypothetical protein